MLKKITTMLVAVFALSAMAAYQYNFKGNQGWLTFDSPTEVSLGLGVGSSKNKDNGQINWIDRGQGVRDYGWYNMDTGEHGSLANNASATFTENDRIGLYVQLNNGDTVYTTTKPGKDAPDQVVWGKSTSDDEGIRLYGGNKGSNGTGEFYVFKVSNTNTSGKAPSGQPLPGIIATLLIGGGTAVYLKKRKKLYEAK